MVDDSEIYKIRATRPAKLYDLSISGLYRPWTPGATFAVDRWAYLSSYTATQPVPITFVRDYSRSPKLAPTV